MTSLCRLSQFTFLICHQLALNKWIYPFICGNCFSASFVCLVISQGKTFLGATVSSHCTESRLLPPSRCLLFMLSVAAQSGDGTFGLGCLCTWASGALALDVSSTCCDKQISLSFILSLFYPHVLLPSFIFYLCETSQKNCLVFLL